MKRTALVTVALAGCTRMTPPPPPPPPPPRVDTVVVTREVPPPLPQGAPATLCLSTGYPMPVLISPAGDTLIGEKRISIKDVRPGLVFEGTYAAGRSWLSQGELTFERRLYKRVDAPVPPCDELKDIGDLDGVPLFAHVGAPSPIETIFIPVRPGFFQPFRTQLPRRR